MDLNLTQKERKLLEDHKSSEEICIMKYHNYANQAQDPELKQMFRIFAAQEESHLNTINAMLNGQIPNMQQNQQAGQQQGSPMQNSTGLQNSSDKDLCTDMLMTEKYVSDTYDTAIFEFVDTRARQALNHIQKEEQQHGEGIFNYMQKKGYYQVN